MLQIGDRLNEISRKSRRLAAIALTSIAFCVSLWLTSCSGSSDKPVEASGAVRVGVVNVVRKSLGRQLMLSS